MRFLNIYLERFPPPFCTRSFLTLSLFWTVLSCWSSKWKWLNAMRTMSKPWTFCERYLNQPVSERWTLCEQWRRAHAERWTQFSERWANGERTMNARWMDGERTQKRVSRTFHGLYIYPHNVIICSLSIICKIHKPPLFNLGLYIPQKDKIFFISIN